MSHFTDALADAVISRRTPVCVGLDPRWNQLPAPLAEAHVDSTAGRAAAYREFCRGVIDAVADLVPVVKPQSAFFEELGPVGVTALVDVIAHAQQRGLLVILDAKRNDIGSTAEAYARGMLGRDAAPWRGDALTVSPYLGEDSLTPFVEVAQQRAAGLFVLVKTSNPGGGLLQDLTADGQTVYRHTAALVERMSAETAGRHGYGIVGAVAGATYPEQLVELRSAMPHTWFLVPGYGSQGAGAADVAGAFDDRGLGAVINNSRALIFAYRQGEYAERFGEAKWQDAVAAATTAMIDELAAGSSAGQLRSS
ncbi:MAG: orotidine-5'-phosphate decarboxylase [Planctomycetaceae bacterium]|nr:orotidine-5'-phosphate decarboxylase [Planctomycetaceae bacterium]